MNIWIIDALSGVTILYRNSLGLEIDADLVAGFLTALNLFSEHEVSKPDMKIGIESIDMSGLKWVYTHAPEYRLIFIAADIKETNAEILRSRLIVIKKDFLSQYAKTQAEWEENWKGYIQPFIPYGDNIEIFMSQWKKAEKFQSFGILFDLMGVFQQILNLCIDVIEKHMSGGSKKRIYRNIKNFYSRFIEAIESKNDNELSKIKFTKEIGWDLLSIDLNKVDPKTIPRVFLDIVKTMKNYIFSNLGKKKALNAFSEELYPYILNNWNLLKELDLEKHLFTIFLNLT